MVATGRCDSRGVAANLDYRQEHTMIRPDGTWSSWTEETVLAVDEPEIRVEKVLDIRRQLGEGRYSVADRLDAVVDRIIADLQ
jgi:hypothetical protein